MKHPNFTQLKWKMFLRNPRTAFYYLRAKYSPYGTHRQDSSVRPSQKSNFAGEDHLRHRERRQAYVGSHRKGGEKRTHRTESKWTLGERAILIGAYFCIVISLFFILDLLQKF